MKNCGSLDEVRTELDAIDLQIAKLIGERNALVKQAAKFKKSIGEIKAEDRVRFVINRAREIGIGYGVNPNLMEDIFAMMIDKMVETELQEFQNRGDL